MLQAHKTAGVLLLVVDIIIVVVVAVVVVVVDVVVVVVVVVACCCCVYETQVCHGLPVLHTSMICKFSLDVCSCMCAPVHVVGGFVYVQSCFV